MGRMLNENLMEPAQTEWASPVYFVREMDGTLRFCVDYWKSNTVTVSSSYRFPRMDECIKSLGSAQLLSTMESNSGYWQIGDNKRDR